MKVTIPLYYEKFQREGRELFLARPLMFTGVDATRPELKRATDSLRNALRGLLMSMNSEARHDSLAWYLQMPELREERVKLRLNLKRRNVEVSYLFVVWQQGELRLAMTPKLLNLTFELGRGESLESRAEAVLTAHYRRLQRDDEPCEPAMDGINGSAWVGHLDLNLNLDALHVAPVKRDRAEMGSFANMRGADELARVGRQLNALYPDGLTRAVRRDETVDELERLLAHDDKRALMITGRSGVGKTAVIHEVVRRRMAGKEGIPSRGQIWLVSPQRLISGMSYVGQWENRVHAILDECKRRGHVLFFDDLVGLFRAGISANSKVSVAQVLKPHLERREVRILAEITPEQLRRLNEIDRGFADLFHLMPLAEPDAPEAMRILVHHRRELEATHKCRFTADVLPTAADLMQRYRREVALPGKVAGFMTQLAVKHHDKTITRTAALQQFEAGSGLRFDFLDDSRRLDRVKVEEALRRRIVGQHQAVKALADIVILAKARLNDPDRPLGSLLFLGPTGVGKTECAKALADYFYGDSARLLRFDMNEFLDSYAVSRLVGTFNEPEGLLTSAVRRQPFSLILLDEIEKAHPAAFDVLLQVLGEGRLTDALGRTADFSNCVIIMTSNLGAREAQGGLGLAGHDVRGDAAFAAAARKFFRPEFFNRIDRIVPFSALDLEQVKEIAVSQMDRVFAREGFERRRCVLSVEPDALRRIVDSGYHPTLGARAIKREIERELTRPLAARMAELRPGAPSIVRVAAAAEGLAVDLTPMHPAVYTPAAAGLLLPGDAEALVARIDRLLNRSESVLSEIQPPGAIRHDDVTPAVRRYFALREQVRYLDDAVERYLDSREQAPAKPSIEPGVGDLIAGRARRAAMSEALPAGADGWIRLQSPNDVRGWLSDRAEDPGEDQATGRLRGLLAAAAWLNLMLDHEAQEDERVLLVMRGVNRSAAMGESLNATIGLWNSINALLRRRFDLATQGLEMQGAEFFAAQWVSGYLARDLCAALAGLHLLCTDRGVRPLSLEVMADEAGLSKPPDLHGGRLVQVHYADGQTLDVRSGMLSRERPSLALLARWLLESLPMPPDAPGEDDS